jgi:hypothetical protein
MLIQAEPLVLLLPIDCNEEATNNDKGDDSEENIEQAPPLLSVAG